MDLTHTADHENFREAARDFAKRVIEPGIRERDEKALADVEIFRKMGAEGFLGAKELAL